MELGAFPANHSQYMSSMMPTNFFTGGWENLESPSPDAKKATSPTTWLRSMGSSARCIQDLVDIHSTNESNLFGPLQFLMATRVALRCGTYYSNFIPTVKNGA